MLCRIEDLRNKEVICVSDGSKLGLVGDVEVDCNTARLESLVVFGRTHFFGLLGKEEDSVIPWEKINVIGSDTILVNVKPLSRKKSSSSFLSKFFEIK